MASENLALCKHCFNIGTIGLSGSPLRISCIILPTILVIYNSFLDLEVKRKATLFANTKMKITATPFILIISTKIPFI